MKTEAQVSDIFAKNKLDKRILKMMHFSTKLFAHLDERYQFSK